MPSPEEEFQAIVDAQDKDWKEWGEPIWKSFVAEGALDAVLGIDRIEDIPKLTVLKNGVIIQDGGENSA